MDKCKHCGSKIGKPKAIGKILGWKFAHYEILKPLKKLCRKPEPNLEEKEK